MKRKGRNGLPLPSMGEGGRMFGMFFQNICIKNDMSLFTSCGALFLPWSSWWSHSPVTGSSEKNRDLGLTCAPSGASVGWGLPAGAWAQLRHSVTWPQRSRLVTPVHPVSTSSSSHRDRHPRAPCWNCPLHCHLRSSRQR